MEAIIECIHTAADIPQKRSIEAAMGWNVKGMGKVQPPHDDLFCVQAKSSQINAGGILRDICIPLRGLYPFPFFLYRPYYRMTIGKGYPWIKSDQGTWLPGTEVRTDYDLHFRFGFCENRSEEVLFTHDIIPQTDAAFPSGHSFAEKIDVWNAQEERFDRVAYYSFKRI